MLGNLTPTLRVVYVLQSKKNIICILTMPTVTYCKNNSFDYIFTEDFLQISSLLFIRLNPRKCL